MWHSYGNTIRAHSIGLHTEDWIYKLLPGGRKPIIVYWCSRKLCTLCDTRPSIAVALESFNWRKKHLHTQESKLRQRRHNLSKYQTPILHLSSFRFLFTVLSSQIKVVPFISLLPSWKLHVIIRGRCKRGNDSLIGWIIDFQQQCETTCLSGIEQVWPLLLTDSI